MSGRIKLIDADGNKLSEDNLPAIPYEYDVIQPFDDSCGSFGLEQWQLPHPQCPTEFVCGADALPSTTPTEGAMSDQTYAHCTDSMNCAMLNGMTTNYGGDGDLQQGGTDDIVLFMRQMIPHHQNAVNMAKALLKSNTAVCSDIDPDDDSVGCIMEPMIRGIINGQNHQIQTMRGMLERMGVTEWTSDCLIKSATGETAASAGGSTSSGSGTSSGGGQEEGDTISGATATSMLTSLSVSTILVLVPIFALY